MKFNILNGLPSNLQRIQAVLFCSPIVCGFEEYVKEGELSVAQASAKILEKE